jgi:hypothetical protein
MAQNRDEPNPTPEKKDTHSGEDDFKSTVDLPGKTDSGPEPDVAGKEVPPQD